MATRRLAVTAAIGALVVAIACTSLFSSLSFTTYSETTNASFENATISKLDSSLIVQDNKLTIPILETTNGPLPVSPTITPTTLSASMGFEGKTIPECCCSFCELEEANLETVYPLLQKVVETPFFSHFKIDLCSSCELWEDAPLCKMKDCSVCECEEPPEWSQVPELPPTGPDPSCAGIADDSIVTGVDSSVLEGWKMEGTSLMGGGDLSFLMGNDEIPVESTGGAEVVDLLKNPEGYTGYSGPSAEKVWSAIHSQNCFQKGDTDNDDLYCSLTPEQRLYNRFISGLHSSISLHIAHSYCLEMDPYNTWECRMWGPNDVVAYERVLNYPDRVENLYVAFSLLLRAVIKAESSIAAAVPASDPILQDSLDYWQNKLLPELLALPHRAPTTFDESALLNLDDAQRIELQRRFEELQSIMQCVGCDRCKLWGTLQTLGVGTALRVLFHNPSANSIELSRQEAVALVNTLERLSSSLLFAKEFRTRREETNLFDNDEASCVGQ